MADTMSQIGIAIPQGLIEDLVRAAVVRELGGQQELIEGIVNQALSQKKDSYSKGTIFQDQVATMIRDVAREAVQEWVASKKEEIKAAFLKHLSSRDGLPAKKMVEGLVDGISKYNVSVKFDWDN